MGYYETSIVNITISSMADNIFEDDIIPIDYPYHWTSYSSISIEEWTKKYKPSMVQNNDGTKPWLWVSNSNPDASSGDRSGAQKEASELLTEVTQRVKDINEDDSIPIRASKKTNKKSKKQVRDEVLAEYTQKLKDVHIRHGYKSGKWLIFVPPNAVDAVWSRLAISVATGLLSNTTVNLAKVATTPPNDSPAQRVICVYMPDIFDKESVLNIMRVLLEHHGVNLSGVKSNLYTDLRLDSKHPSHLQSTIWKTTDFMKDTEIKELREEYFAQLKASQAAKGVSDDQEESTKPQAQVPKPKAPVDDDPFASEDEDQSESTKKKRPATDDRNPTKKSKRSHPAE